MKRIFSALVVALCMMLPSKANDTNNTDAHNYGHVIDKTTGEHLPYIMVYLKGTTIGVATENTGHYLIRHVP
jgi:outer membrane receptor for ferrienterochelin and colicins